ncbi:MAG: hypothetical protein ACRC2T_12770 [Thermoguttaceae bacterium]
MIKELQQIEKMMEDEQNAACLAYIEQLEKSKPDCACLTAAKLTMLRSLERWDEAVVTAKAFLEREPNNALAASELAISYSFCDQWNEAISTIIDGIERWDESSIHSSLLTGLLVVGEKALSDGNIIPALCIARQLQLFEQTLDQGVSLYLRAYRSQLPIIAKEMSFNLRCPADFAAAETFNKGASYIASARWKKGLAILESLSDQADKWPELWKNIALLRICLGNISGAVEACSRYIACPNVTLEDAADVELLRLCMIPDPLGDIVDTLVVSCTISDAEKVQEILLSNKHFQTISFDIREFTDYDQAPPKSAFALMDRPLLEEGQELTAETISTHLCDCFLFGKQTDRDAKLELTGINSFNQAKAVSFLKELLADWITSWDEPVKVSSLSGTLARLHPRYVVDQNTVGDSNAVHEKVQQIFEKEFFDSWCNLPLGLLDGKTPIDAAKDPKYHVRLLGVIQVIDFWAAERLSESLCDDLRTHLGLPTYGIIPVPPQFSRDAEDAKSGVSEADKKEATETAGYPPTFLDEVPRWRWHRIDVKSLPLDSLIQGVRAVGFTHDTRAGLPFCKELLEFPFSKVPYEIRREAVLMLMFDALLKSDREKAQLYIDQGKNEAAEAKESDGIFNVHEIPLLFAAGETEKGGEIITHILNTHRNEQQVMRMLQRLFVQFGWLNPDGTPARMGMAPENMGPAGSVEHGTPLVGEQTPAAAPASKLWVPD